ncbi:MAG: FAD-dependent oxidoreductase [Fimbriimonadaceae bacterium]
MSELNCDILIVGGGTGGVAAAQALADKGLRVILTEETDWLGGQFTSQAVPPDEHPWIETMGCTARYRDFRNQIRHYYRAHRDLTPEARRNRRLNPGGGWVSHLCFEPAIGGQILANSLIGTDVQVLFQTIPISASTRNDEVESVTVKNLETGAATTIRAKFFLDATELGDLLPMTGAEYRIGAESKAQTGEPNALDGDPEPDNVQGITWCAILSYDPSGDHTIPKPEQFDFWREYHPPHWPDKLLSFKMLHVQRGHAVDFPLFSDDWFNLFSYRQIVKPEHFSEPAQAATCMNWPMNDYALGSILDVSEEEKEEHLEGAKQLTLSMIYWMQTEQGYPGLMLRPDLAGTRDGLAKSPYIRESRRIEAMHTVCEQDVAAYTNEGCQLAPEMPCPVGIGAYRIDLHPSTNGAPTIDTSTLPFQIPLGSMIPKRMKNLLPACKNIGVTHITNGCYRLHPIEWNIGEVAGLLAWHCLEQESEPATFLEETRYTEFSEILMDEGIPFRWPQYRAL